MISRSFTAAQPSRLRHKSEDVAAFASKAHSQAVAAAQAHLSAFPHQLRVRIDRSSPEAFDERMAHVTTVAEATGCEVVVVGADVYLCSHEADAITLAGIAT